MLLFRAFLSLGQGFSYTVSDSAPQEAPVRSIYEDSSKCFDFVVARTTKQPLHTSPFRNWAIPFHQIR